MILSSLIPVTEDMWGSDAQVFETEVDGIYDATTSSHGGYLVDINLHPELKKYSVKTINPSLHAFEEDYEALKVLWLYPQLLKCPQKVDEWLTCENVTKYEKNQQFIKDFPKRKVLNEVSIDTVINERNKEIENHTKDEIYSTEMLIDYINKLNSFDNIDDIKVKISHMSIITNDEYYEFDLKKEVTSFLDVLQKNNLQNKYSINDLKSDLITKIRNLAELYVIDIREENDNQEI